MAMFAPIPLPGIDNPQFKDVMDYYEQLQLLRMRKDLILDYEAHFITQGDISHVDLEFPPLSLQEEFDF